MFFQMRSVSWKVLFFTILAVLSPFSVCEYHVMVYFTTERLHEQYMVSSRKNRWLYCPLAPAGSIKFSVLPAGMKMFFFHELLHQFS